MKAGTGKHESLLERYALVLNAGSSSLKFCIFVRPEAEKWQLEARGQIEGIGASARIMARSGTGHSLVNQDLGTEVREHRDALGALAAWIRSVYGGSRVVGVGHRVAHGGTSYASPTLITPEVVAELRRFVPLAPLHQPYNLAVIDAVSERLPDVPQVACFDTAFHRTLSPLAELVPLPAEIRKTGVQRYGFHGLSYEYIASILPTEAPEIAAGKVVVAHLGDRSSLCALENCKSVDTTFGFAELDGLCMATRPGSLDPGVVLHLFQTLGLTAKQVQNVLYNRSGLVGISGFSNDMRDLLASNAPEARLAVDYFVYRAAKEIGAMAASLRGIEALVFTAGIGQNSAEIRRRICEASSWLGIELDEAANRHKGPRISTPNSKPSAWVIPTNEELMIARHTGHLLDLVAATHA